MCSALEEIEIKRKKNRLKISFIGMFQNILSIYKKPATSYNVMQGQRLLKTPKEQPFFIIKEYAGDRMFFLTFRQSEDIFCKPEILPRTRLRLESHQWNFCLFGRWGQELPTVLESRLKDAGLARHVLWVDGSYPKMCFRKTSDAWGPTIFPFPKGIL